jgi:uncharacterized protein
MGLLEEIKKRILRLIGRGFMVRGHCIRCGACCREMTLYFSGEKIRTEEDFKKLCEAWSYYSMFSITRRDPAGFFVFTCANIDDSSLCKIYKTRPPICRKYPDPYSFEQGHRLPEGCGYEAIALKSFEEFLHDEEKHIES